MYTSDKTRASYSVFTRSGRVLTRIIVKFYDKKRGETSFFVSGFISSNLLKIL
jgi:hypothetical protein